MESAIGKNALYLLMESFEGNRQQACCEPAAKLLRLESLPSIRLEFSSLGHGCIDGMSEMRESGHVGLICREQVASHVAF